MFISGLYNAVYYKTDRVYVIINLNFVYTCHHYSALQYNTLIEYLLN